MSKVVMCCKLDKMPEGKLTSMNNCELCDFDTKTSSTVTARYYKGIGVHKDNMVIELSIDNELPVSKMPKAKQSKAKQSKAKQSKAKQSKANNIVFFRYSWVA